MFHLSKNFTFELELNEGVLWHIADINPEKAWEMRGLPGKNSNLFDIQIEEEKKIIIEKLKTAETRKRLNNFYKESNDLLQSILSGNKNLKNEYIGTKNFTFIAGAPRSGGTYIYSEVSTALNWPHSNLLVTMTHDNIPDAKFINRQNNPLGWRSPLNFFSIVFQMCQFLVYIKHVLPNTENIVLKQMSLSRIVPILNFIFGENSSLILTVRHPASVSASRVKGFKNTTETDEFRKATFNLWKNIYGDIAQDDLPSGNLTALKYGKDMDEFLSDFYKKNGKDVKPSGIRITERKYDTEYWNRAEIVSEMRQIEKSWELKGFEFPYPDKIL